MSSYVNFYLRINDLFISLGSWRRSSEMYQALRSESPYGKIRSFSYKDLLEIATDLNDKIDHLKEMKENDENQCQMILQANNSLDEKMEAINEIRNNSEEIDSIIKEVGITVATLHVFCDMIKEYKYNSVKLSNDCDHYVYVGIDANGDLESIVK